MTSEQMSADDGASRPPPRLRRAALVYTAGRFALFLMAAMLIWSVTGLAGHQLNGLPLLLVALLVSSIIGLFLFARQREQFAQALAAKRAAKVEQIADRRARLDNDGQ